MEVPHGLGCERLTCRYAEGRCVLVVLWVVGGDQQGGTTSLKVQSMTSSLLTPLLHSRVRSAIQLLL